MSHFHLYLASFVFAAILGIGSADYRDGRSLQPYQTNTYEPYESNQYDYRAGRSLKPYQPYNENNDYKAGRSLKPYYQPHEHEHEHEHGYRAGRSLKPYYQPHEHEHGYRAGRSLKPYQPQHNYPGYKPEDKPAGVKIQGLIYCKTNAQLSPMQGATARVTCEVRHKNGYESAPFSVDTPVTDKNGYFLINLGKYSEYSFNNCKVFLDQAAHGDYCNVRTNTNNGISGATPAKPRRLSGNYVLYSVAPFAFSSSY